MCTVSNARVTFSSCDLDLYPMTLVYKLDLDIVMLYLHAKNEVSRKLQHEQG